MTPWTPSRERLKEFLYNVARLVDAPGIPSRLLADQTALGERVKRATFHVEECLSSLSPPDVIQVSDTLAGLLGETFYTEFDACPKIEALDEARSEPFAHHVHSHVMLAPPVETLADLTGGATREDVDRCLSCLPLGVGPGGVVPLDLEPLALSLAPSQPTTSSGFGGLLNTSSAAGSGPPFLFISYARDDRDRVYPVVEKLITKGASIWFDRRIIGGDDWLVELESQLLRCAGILAFVSRSFVASKYCGREVRFGDALDKKIIPIFLEQAELSGGMNFILHTIQRIIIADENDCAAIIAAIRMHAPTAYVAG